MREIIKLENVSKFFQGKISEETKAVEEVSFSVYEGETLGIVGESGSGKSTIARLVTGLIPLSSGEIYVNDIKLSDYIKKDSLDFYSKIQMVFQNPTASFDPRRTLGDGIGESLTNRGMKGRELRSKVEELLLTCGLDEEFSKKYPHQVSGGQCQRAAIARALAIEPSVLICDEATSALDVTIQKQIIELLSTLKKERKLTIIFICHNLALVQMFCDRVIVLKEGRIVEEGSTNVVIQNPTNEYTKMLVDSVL